jgi:hypothetical protein
MSGRPQRRIIRTSCGKCGGDIRVDITDFEPSIAITNSYRCENTHESTLYIRNGKILAVSLCPAVESDIEQFADVPDHIKTLVKEAYKCSAYDIPIAGACTVRRLLDELLYDLGFRNNFVGSKVTAFETKCNNDAPFKQTNETVFRRLAIFKTVAGLSGFHAHAQGTPITAVIKSEFEQYLHAVEGAIEDHWPRRST